MVNIVVGVQDLSVEEQLDALDAARFVARQGSLHCDTQRDGSNRRPGLAAINRLQPAAVFAELESNATSDRVKEGMKMKKEKGEFMGRISYGWRLSNGKGADLIENEEQQEVIRKIKEMRKEGMKVPKIINYLEEIKYHHQKPQNNGIPAQFTI